MSTKDFLIAIGVEVDANGVERFAAWVFDFPGCRAEGITRIEAREKLARILPEYIDAMKRNGVSLPEPTQLPAIMLGAVGFYDQTHGQPVTPLPGELAETNISFVPAHELI